MTSIQSIDHPSVPAERILPRSTGPSGKAQTRQGAEITRETASAGGKKNPIRIVFPVKQVFARLWGMVK